MPRPKNPNPPVRLEVQLPARLDARLRLDLFSEVEGRVPQGALSTFIVTLLEAYYKKRDEGTAIQPQEGPCLIAPTSTQCSSWP